LRAWLDCARAIGGKLPAVNYADKFKRALEKSRLRAESPQNALRHSFASYHYARHRNENETAALMGNSQQMVFAHYRELVRPAEGGSLFWNHAAAGRAGRRQSCTRRATPSSVNLRVPSITVFMSSSGGMVEEGISSPDYQSLHPRRWPWRQSSPRLRFLKNSPMMSPRLVELGA
jgi:hypothetical protein